MNIAIIGSRTVQVDNIGEYLPKDVTGIISGGARGVDRCAEKYARENGIPILVIRPNYPMYGRGAPLKRNLTIVDQSDYVLAFWDGTSRGTKYTIDYANTVGVPVRIIRV